LTEYQPLVAQNAITIKKDIVKNKNNAPDNREDIPVLFASRHIPVIAVSAHQQNGIDNSEEERSDM
jgi:hypothetical protein